MVSRSEAVFPLLGELQDASDRYREEGNRAAAIKDTAEALRLYSLSLQADGSNVKSRNNRAQMLLSAGRFRESLEDSALVLAAEPGNAKALFRSAQALEGLQRPQEAVAMYDQMLAIDPGNTSAALGRKKLLAGLSPPQGSANKGISVLPESTASRASATGPASLSGVPVNKSVIASPPVVVQSKSPVSAEARAKPLKVPLTVPTKEPAVPTTLPVSVYELERVWRGLRGRADLFAAYLRTFKKSTFKKVHVDIS